MSILTRFLLRTFLPVFLASLAFFVLIVELVDLFANLVRYLDLHVSAAEILHVQILYLPRAVGYALPVALLFAVGFSIGTLYSNNELIAVFSSGVPLWRFTLPLLVLGLVLSVGSFFFHEYVVIDTFRSKNELSRRLLNITRSFSNTNITIRNASGRIIYSADYYNDSTRELSRVLVIERDGEGMFVSRIDAASGRWQGGNWVWEHGTHYTRLSEDDDRIAAEPFRRMDEARFDMEPRRFQRSAREVDEMRFDEARSWVFGLRDAGQPYRQSLTEYYNRFAFSLTPFIVVLLSSALGGRFRRNVLLMSLLISLIAAVVYYVAGMIAGILAGDGLIPPIVGAWSGAILFTALGTLLFRTAKT